jgi:NAD(P)-dependent dehydrogenase (short-subunit alcohol dehydrogenase family)
MEVMKTIIVTGASDGIGAAAARQLAEQGHRVLMVGRSPAKLEAAAAQAGVSEWYAGDYTSLDDVRRLAGQLRAATDRIDVLANNAGGVFPAPLLTADGFERTFQVNYLAGFLLTHDLLDRLIASQGAVINTASVAAQVGGLDFGDLDSRGHFVSMRAYGRGKLADILHSRGLHARYQARGVSAMAFHPGNIASNFAATMGGAMATLYTTPLKRLLTPADQGGANLAHFAAGTPGQTWLSGRYYHSNRRLGHTHRQGYDLEVVDRLWERTNQLLGLTDV